MRCPKCGFISFDQPDTCAKCSHSFAGIAEQIHGASARVEAPFFLRKLLEPGAGEKALETEDGLDVIEEEAESAEEEALEISEEGTAPAEEEAPILNLEGLDVSDLVPPQEESASAFNIEEDDSREEEFEGELPEEEPEALGKVASDEIVSPDLPDGLELEGNKPFVDDEEEGIVDLSAFLTGEDEYEDVEAEGEEEGIGYDLGLEEDDEEPSSLDMSLDDLSVESEEEEDVSGEEAVGKKPLELHLEQDEAESEESPVKTAEDEGGPKELKTGSGLTLESNDE